MEAHMYRKYRTNRRPEARGLIVKYAAACICCGAEIKAGEYATYYPVGTIASQTEGKIGHPGGLEGNSARCTSNIAAGYVDPGELAADRWNETHGDRR
jgi:hypothetical protein